MFAIPHFLDTLLYGKKTNYSHFRIIIVMILSFRTDRSMQTVQTQIRLLLEEQSDQGLHCLPFCLHLRDTLYKGKATLFRIITAIISGQLQQLFQLFFFLFFTVCCT